jgi:7-cyano-7-deazaguanine synthase in queuosine biosynthesis
MNSIRGATHEFAQGQPAWLKGRRITLALFSGGIDSTHLVWDLLANSNEIVLAHHVHLINNEGRHGAEARACAAIVPHLRRCCRNFFFTESAVERRRFRAAGADVITVAFEGGVAASNFLLDTGVMPHRWMLGINAEELAEISAAEEGAPRRLTALQAAMAAATWPNRPPLYERPQVKPKRLLIEEMGQQLAAMCWTCRQPVATRESGFAQCGQCKTCRLMAQIGGGQTPSIDKPLGPVEKE